MITTVLAILLQAQHQPEYLAVDGMLIGYRQKGNWHDPDKLKNRKAHIHFQHVGIGSATGSYEATGFEKETDGPESIDLNGPDSGREGVLFSGMMTFPRPVKVLSNQNDVYLKILGTFLKQHGIHSKPRLTRVISADLDGAGTDEVIIEGSSRDDLTRKGPNRNKKGDYSIVLLRYLQAGKVVSKPLAFGHPKGEELAYMNKLVAVGDFDGDGTMEMVLTSDYYEGGSGALVRYRKGKITGLAEFSAGA